MADVVRSYTHAQDHDGSWDSEYPYDGDTQTHGLMYEDTTTGEWKDISSDLPYDVFYEDGYASTYYIYSANGAWVEHTVSSILFTSADYVSGPDITFSHPNLAPGDTTNKLTINGREVDIQVGDCILLYNESGDEHSSIYPSNILHNFVVSKTYDDYYEYYKIITTAWYIEPGVWSNTSGSNDPTHRIVLANCAGDENGDHGYLDPFYDTPYQRVVHWFEIEPADLSADDTRNQITVNGQTITAQYGNYISFIYGTEYYTTNITDTIEQHFPQSPGLMTYIYPGIWADCDPNPLNVAEYSYIYHEAVKSHVQLKWTDPQDLTDWDPYPCTWEGTVIVRKEDSPPLHRWDGEKVVRTTTRDKYKTEPYKDEDIVSGKTYYYAFMPYYTRYEDPDHPIRFYTFTKVIKVEIGDKSLSSTIDSIDVDGTNATINYTLSQPDGGSFTSIKMYGKIGKNPKCDNTDDVVEDVDSSSTTLSLTGLEPESTYYFCLVTMDTNNKKLSSNVMSCNIGEDESGYTFGFTDDEQTFVVPETGTYRLETWGAQGQGSDNNRGGYGSYSIGEMVLTAGQTIYINVGGQNGYNGGGNYITGTIRNIGMPNFTSSIVFDNSLWTNDSDTGRVTPGSLPSNYTMGYDFLDLLMNAEIGTESVLIYENNGVQIYGMRDMRNATYGGWYNYSVYIKDNGEIVAGSNYPDTYYSRAWYIAKGFDRRGSDYNSNVTRRIQTFGLAFGVDDDAQLGYLVGCTKWHVGYYQGAYINYDEFTSVIIENNTGEYGTYCNSAKLYQALKKMAGEV